MKKTLLILFTLGTIVLTQAQDRKLTISGFSEARFESRFGGSAEQAQYDSLKASGADLEDDEENTRLFVPGITLNILGELHEKLYFQGEVQFEFEGGHTFKTELYRAYLDYRIHPKFNLQAGKFLSPIGFLNRNQRFYGYLNNSVKPREMVFEDTEYIPLFTVGLEAYGTFEMGDVNSLKYIISYGGMRQEAPMGTQISAMELGQDGTAPGLAALLEWTSFKGDNEYTLGLSGYINPRIQGVYIPNGGTFIEDVDTGVEMDLKETGFAPYLRINTNKLQFLGEYHSIKFEDVTRVSGKSNYSYNAASLELMYKTKANGKPFGPYVRYDFREVDGDHPYYGKEDDDGVQHKSFVPNQSEAVFGFVWDLFPSNKFKVEYGAAFQGATAKGRLSISTSFAF